MKSKKLMILATCAVFIACVFVTNHISKNGISSTLESLNPTSRISASWAKTYEDVSSLTSDSDFIGLVEIVEIVAVIEEGVAESPIYLTVYSAKVLNSILTEDERIDIVMTGKHDEQGMLELRDDPLMSIGDTWFIFARKNASGPFTILGGPTGRFIYNKDTDTVTSLNRIVIPESQLEDELNVSLFEVQLSEIISEIRQLSGGEK